MMTKLWYGLSFLKKNSKALPSQEPVDQNLRTESQISFTADMDTKCHSTEQFSCAAYSCQLINTGLGMG